MTPDTNRTPGIENCRAFLSTWFMMNPVYQKIIQMPDIRGGGRNLLQKLPI